MWIFITNFPVYYYLNSPLKNTFCIMSAFSIFFFKLISSLWDTYYLYNFIFEHFKNRLIMFYCSYPRNWNGTGFPSINRPSISATFLSIIFSVSKIKFSDYIRICKIWEFWWDTYVHREKSFLLNFRLIITTVTSPVFYFKDQILLWASR